MSDQADDLVQQLKHIDIDTRPVFDMVIPVREPIEFGQTPRGERRVRIGEEGVFRGERLEGKVLAGGTNWFLSRGDGVGEFSVRLGLETTGGERIYMQSDGYFHFAEGVGRKIAAGSATPGDYYFRERTRFETASEALDWLNAIVAVGSGWVGPGLVGMSIHEIT